MQVVWGGVLDNTCARKKEYPINEKRNEERNRPTHRVCFVIYDILNLTDNSQEYI
jgi:hypothetical protein